MDAHEHLRNLPLMLVLDALLGEQTWKARKSGTEWYGRCPVHQAKKNTTSFSFDDEGKFHCFSCNVKGRGSIDLVMAIKQIGFRDACAILEELRPKLVGLHTQIANDGGSKPQSEDSEAVKVHTQNPSFKGSYEKFKVDSPWLRDRGLSDAILDRYEVFQYDNPKRRSVYSGSVMLKIRRWSDGEAVGYLSRNIGEVTPEKPKYRFPAGFQKSLELFGAFQLKEKAPVRVLYLVESPFAVMAFHQRGFAAVSPFGFSVSAEQIRTIAQLAKGVVYLPDRNKRDQIAGCIEALSRFLWVKAPELPAGSEDPEALDRNQIVGLAGSS